MKELVRERDTNWYVVSKWVRKREGGRDTLRRRDRVRERDTKWERDGYWDGVERVKPKKAIGEKKREERKNEKNSKSVSVETSKTAQTVLKKKLFLKNISPLLRTIFQTKSKCGGNLRSNLCSLFHPCCCCCCFRVDKLTVARCLCTYLLELGGFKPFHKLSNYHLHKIWLGLLMKFLFWPLEWWWIAEISFVRCQFMPQEVDKLNFMRLAWPDSSHSW